MTGVKLYAAITAALAAVVHWLAVTHVTGSFAGTQYSVPALLLVTVCAGSLAVTAVTLAVHGAVRA